MAGRALNGDSLTHAVARDMRQTRRTPVSLVEMNVALHEGREKEPTFEIDAVIGRRCLPWRSDRTDESVGDLHLGEIPRWQPRIGQNPQIRFNRFAAAYL